MERCTRGADCWMKSPQHSTTTNLKLHIHHHFVVGWAASYTFLSNPPTPALLFDSRLLHASLPSPLARVVGRSAPTSL